MSKSGPKKLEDLEAEGKLAMDRLEDIANYMGDYRDIVEEYAVSEERSLLGPSFFNASWPVRACFFYPPPPATPLTHASATRLEQMGSIASYTGS